MRKKEWWKTGVAARVVLACALAIGVSMLASTAALAFGESPVAGGKSAEAAPPPPPPESMSVVPEEEEPSSATPSPGASEAPAPASKPRTHHARKSAPVDVEPASARLRITRDTWIFSGPSKWTKHITRAHSGKFVEVSGSTRYYLQVRLKDGQTGYILPSDVDLVKPSDKVFQLTQDSAVLQAPNRWGKKLSQVHRGHSVHVTGVSLNYMQIRMKSGLVGFIPATALQ